MNKINIKLFLFLLLVGVLVGYFIFQGREYLVGPQIIIEFPKPAEVVSQSYVNVKGRAFNVSTLSLNGRQIFTDEKGLFNEGLLLARGYNIIEVAASDKFGRMKKERLETILQ